MSYLVLARKWRPKTFQDLMGQTHVVGALTGAFERGHLHHAYLLTGTRGVGKTTIARILAKAFNCETGITATPCGVCPTCEQIDSGRFPDMLEIDAASHTGVDNVREILDNAHYLPTMGRFKVYLIDEVHMLSKAAFNAMLKTLEEPPHHVKFILATTDPQKIPPTVLSRCLQFHLRPLQRPQIEARFDYILNQESIAFEQPALTLLANAAQGSLRDGLSLLDQAIAYGGGSVQEAVVRNMLGIADQGITFQLLEALEQKEAPQLATLIDQLAQETHAFESVLDEIAQQLHRIALIQQVPDAINHYPQDSVKLKALAERLPAETVQLFYQIALHGKRDLALAPDALAGFTMTLLRMLAFRPIVPGAMLENTASATRAGQAAASSNIPSRSHSSSTAAAASIPSLRPERPAPSAVSKPAEPAPAPSRDLFPLPSISAIGNGSNSADKPSYSPSSAAEQLPSSAVAASASFQAQDVRVNLQPNAAQPDSVPLPSAPTPTAAASNDINHAASAPSAAGQPDNNEAWQALIPSIKVSPMTRQLLLQSAWKEYANDTLTLTVAPQHKHLLTFQKELNTALQAVCGPRIQLNVETFEDAGAAETLDTPALRLKAAEQEQHTARVEAFASDPFVQTLCAATGAQVDENTVRPVASLPQPS